MKYELLLWINHFLKNIPGKIGCKLRNCVMPYKNGKNVYIWDGVHIDKASNLQIGNNVSINRGCIINAGGRIIIGDNVLIGPRVIIYSQNHNFREISKPKRLQGYSYKPVYIEENVWIASNCIILPGVTIGANSVIGAGSIVTKDVPENTLFYGGKYKKIQYGPVNIEY